LQPFGVPPKLSSSLNIAKSIAAGMAAEVRDDVAASSPLAALTMTKETSKTGRACLFILLVSSKVKRKQTKGLCYFRLSYLEVWESLKQECERLLKENVVYKTCRGKPNHKPINYVGNSYSILYAYAAYEGYLCQ